MPTAMPPTPAKRARIRPARLGASASGFLYFQVCARHMVMGRVALSRPAVRKMTTPM